MASKLFLLAEEIRRCTSCPLWKKRTLAVPGEGPEKAKIMFIGEAPGAEEDREGMPFIGRSGKFLDQLLKIAGLKRENVFLTGAVKCRPENNRMPTAKELKICRELWLEKQIEIIKPELIVILGRAALKSLLNRSAVKKLHGRMVVEKGQKYFITFHPAAGMRFPETGKLIKADFQKLKFFLSSIK